MKVVINVQYGGFSVSNEAKERYGFDSCYSINRTDEKLIQAVEEMGSAVNGPCAELCVVNIPDEATDYMIQEYDGAEEVYYVVDGKIKMFDDYDEDDNEEWEEN